MTFRNFIGGSWLRALGALAVIATGLAFIAVETADARSKGGSRGSKTHQSVPSTATAPNAAAPLQRTATPRPNPGAAAAANATRPGLLGSMSKGGFMAGLLGAGALGLLLGYGLSGGLGGLASIIGLMLQIGLIVLVAMLVIGWWRSRNQQQPAAAMRQPGAPGSAPGVMGFDRQAQQQPAGPAGAAGGGMFAQQEQSNVPTRPLNLTGEDFGAFERILVDVNAAFAREDEGTLRQLATEEMFSYFAEDVRNNIQQGRAVRISGVRLEQGDLAEAWKEPDAEYATVAMRFTMTDAIVERASGKVIEGSLTEPRELTEIWTFVRQPGGTPQDWVISAIQDAEEGGEAANAGQYGSDGRA